MSADKQNPDSSDITVMVVDDSSTVRQSAGGFLTDMGWNVVTAEDGFDALAKVVESRPALVFIDIMMPRLDGYQTCALIKNNPDYSDIAVVLLSSKDGLFDRARGKVVGANEHLAKPFTRDELKTAVAVQLQHQFDRTESLAPPLFDDPDATSVLPLDELAVDMDSENL
ncbi:MAG: response regulator [Gammaproteobacteria bacterium]|nr:response regulator [Gammaproteobacteria bacterium]